MSGQLAQAWPDRWLADLALAQHGAVALWQLVDAGFTRGAIDSRLRLGRLHIVHRGVYAVGRPDLTREGRWMAAVLALGPTAVLSHHSAAALWGLLPPRDAARIHVTVPSRGARSRRDRLTVHRVPNVESTTRARIPVTSVAWTLLDLAAASAPGDRVVDRAVEEAERLRLFDLRAVERIIATQRTGCRALAVAVEGWDDAPTRSESERRFLALLADHRLPRPVVNTDVEGLEVDFCWPHDRLVVEIDSRRHHGTPQAMERDRHRDARLALAGWRVARFTWRQVRDEPATVAAVVRTHLADLQRSAA